MKYTHIAVEVDSAIPALVTERIVSELNNNEWAELVTVVVDQTSNRTSFVYRVPE